ncbi:hypothetical protein CIPAW_14G093700 [Carya illinoinensis]|uniref:Uncharacterized protein n=1 Tax=Carya illinoinensis TaxID=32201 RepID=A0A8T1NIH3_CARIL|nr:hypothetical protein CIPAW_14G093700 [Carya illinoinensis]
MPKFNKKSQKPDLNNNYRPNRAPVAFNNRGSSSVPQNNSRSQGTSSNRPTCQICGKTNHIALECYERFNYAYQGQIPPTELAAMATATNATLDNQIWNIDSVANAHITSNTANHTTQQPFDGTYMIIVGNGTESIDISKKWD